MVEKIETYKATTKWHKRYGRKMTKYSPSVNGNWCKKSEVRELESYTEQLEKRLDEAVKLLGMILYENRLKDYDSTNKVSNFLKSIKDGE